MAKQAIKMRVNENKSSVCTLCGMKWQNTREMWDLKLGDNIFTLCYNCTDELFHKTLKANCQYNAKVKSKEDMQRITNHESFKRG